MSGQTPPCLLDDCPLVINMEVRHHAPRLLFFVCLPCFLFAEGSCASLETDFLIFFLSLCFFFVILAVDNNKAALGLGCTINRRVSKLPHNS